MKTDDIRRYASDGDSPHDSVGDSLTCGDEKAIRTAATRGSDKPIRTIIFDWDGTLHDTKALYGASVRKTCEWLKSQGYSVPEDLSDERLSRYLGMNPVEMWLDFMPALSMEMREQCSERTGLETLQQIREGRAKLYEGALELLESLRSNGYTLLILSNCKDAYMNMQRETFGLDRYFEEYFTSQAYGFQPKENTFEVIRERYTGGFCMVGDRASDKRVSDVHGIPFIGCRYGFGSEEELGGAGAIDSVDRSNSAGLAGGADAVNSEIGTTVLVDSIGEIADAVETLAAM